MLWLSRTIRVTPIKRGILDSAQNGSIPTLYQRRNFSFEPVLDVLSVGTEYLQTIHAHSGLPWWAFIPISTVVLRTCITLPIAIYQRKGLQKQNELRPIVNAMPPVLKLKLAAAAQAEQLKEAVLKGARTMKSETQKLTADKIIVLAAKEKQKRQRKIFKENGCQTWKFMLLPAIQIPLWMSMSYLFRLLTGWSQFGSRQPLDPTLTTEGFFHVQDLALTDPYMITPVILGLTALTNAEWNFKTADLMKLTTRGVRNSLRPGAFDVVITLTRVSVVFMMVLATQAPVAMVLYWTSSNAYSLIQNMVLDKFMPIRYTPYKRFISNSSVAKNAIPLIKY